MRLLPFAVAASVLTAVSACAPMPPPPPPMAQCNAEGARWAIGLAPDPEVIERITRDTGSRDVRVLHPGTPATMDYRQDRVNVDVNERGAINGIRCG
ncbi:I78 family peptidase inhibitor [Marilutibacter maris]|uniref:Starvation-inducible outer membrane lipoprotein n=1 Tax=Marilutibacter maris TaxID=1605891 RepID=A0A2U9TC99_9GAMM|nr:I78 family peptidase inhibitor [Lysobacter maris]AWV08837.1 starvation-inducible outer membrane lipoprotein [Lysobacter maris]KAB8175125.1 hypothetical protein FKV24_013560 [Lysobacter maris]